MGTRSLTVIADEYKEIVVMYRQFDGYVEGHGKELAEILTPKGVPVPVVNGISGSGMCFNGGGCAAAHIVSSFKTEPGGVYLYPAGTRDCGEEYTYILTVKPNEAVLVEVKEYNDTIFKGSAEDFHEFCNTPRVEEDE